MLTTRKILAHVRQGDWFVSIDLKDAYFQIQIASRHRRFLRFAFEGQAYQYTVLPFGLSLAPRTFTKCMDAALAPLRLRGIRVLNYLNDWLILAQSHSELVEHRTILLDHLENLGLAVNWEKSSLFPRQITSFLGIELNSLLMTARLSSQRTLDIRRAAGSFRCGAIVPLKAFQRMLGLMASASSVLQLGLLRMRPLQFWLRKRVPRTAWASGRLRVKVNQACIAALKPWEAKDWYQSGVSLGTSSRVMVVSTDASTSGWGALLEGRPLFGQWSKQEKLLHINCFEMLAVSKALTRFCPLIKGHHVLIRSDNVSVVSYINRQGGLRSLTLYRLTRRLLIWARSNLLSLRAAHVPGLLNIGPDRLVFAPTDSPAAVEEIRQSGSRPVRVSRKRSLSRIFLEEQGRADPRVASPSSLRFSPRLPPDSGGRTGQGRRMLSAACSPTLDEPTLVPNCDAVSKHRPVASASEEGSPLSSQRLDLASSPRAVVPACVGHQRVPADLPQGVLNTITQARAPSTRRLYASKWSVFSSWCTARGVSPLHCGVTEVLSFLQELLDKGRSPSTLKVYVAAIAVFSSTTLGQSIGRNDLVIRFLRGAKRLNPPRPPTVPIWDLSTVLEAMKGHPFEPLQEIDLKHLSFKTAFLLALALT
ncbi:hypothetical protein PO909_014743 [Leuciscus waleckii]